MFYTWNKIVFESIISENSNSLDILFRLLSSSFLSRYKGDMTSQRLCSSLHITINSSLNSNFFDFAGILKLRNIKNLLFFFSVIFPILMYFLKKTCSNIGSESEISDNNRKKLDESWTWATFLQLNGRGKNCPIF